MSEVIKQLDIHFFYTLTHGGQDFYHFDDKNLWQNCKTIKHCVFNTHYPESDFYISISHVLNQKNNTDYKVIPHMIDLPDCSTNLRATLNIPDDAIVLGRYGGSDQFNIDFVHDTIETYLQNNKQIYFLFMNTRVFYTHPQIIYLDRNLDLNFKAKFINTCNAMLHARSMGETFGLSVGEFSSKNKPIITCNCGDLEHIKILGDKAIIYNNKEELLNIFKNIESILRRYDDWNCYKYYTPENIINLFDEYIFSQT